MMKRFFLGLTLLLMVVSGVCNAQETSYEMAPFDAEAAGASFLEVEAGISAYGKVNAVNLDLAENGYKNVEIKTDQYIVGSVALDDYPESDDVHVYVDITGWMVAYYLVEEKPGKIIDWVEYKNTGILTNTKLADALVKVAVEMWQIVPAITYYDFRYPDATNFLIAVDEKTGGDGTETFQMLVPSSYFLYSRTWSHAIYDYGTHETSGNIKIDTYTLNSFATGGGWIISEGEITPLQLYPDIYHTISVYQNGYYTDDISYVGIVLLYSQF